MKERNYEEFDRDHPSFLRACTDKYEKLVDLLPRVRRHTSSEGTARWIEMVGGFAGMHHPGRFADGAIENVALELGQDLPEAIASLPDPVVRSRQVGTRPDSCLRILHVVTVAIEISGYTKMLTRWIRMNSNEQHSVVLTRQPEGGLSNGLIDTIRHSGGALHSFPARLPLLLRAAWLRKLASSSYDLVVMHLIPDDIVPVIAFAAGKQPPVALVNLADQCFWVGSTVADATINLRDISECANRELRYTRGDVSIVIPLEDFEVRSKRSARESLGIAEGERVALTVGRPMKYSPTARHNFFYTVDRLLSVVPEATLYLVGLSETDIPGDVRLEWKNRMRFLGLLRDPSRFQVASDIYLEGFPFGSQTALLESVLPGRPCVRAVSPRSALLAASDASLDGIATTPIDESDYVRQAADYLVHSSLARETGSALRKRILSLHTGSNWLQSLGKAYDFMTSLTHKVVEIPVTDGMIRDVDCAISELHRARFKEEVNGQFMQDLTYRKILDAAYALRESGCYKDAFFLARTANSVSPGKRRTYTFSAKLVPHFVRSRLRKN